jgi:hypothetical protein
METDLPFPMPGECPRLETGRGTSAIASGATYADETAGGEGGQCRSKLQAIGKSTSAPMHISVRRPMRFIAPLFEPMASQSGSGSVRNFLGGASFRLPWSRGEKANNLQKRADDYQFEADEPCPRFEPVGRDDYRLHCSRRLAESNEFRRQLRASGQHTQNNQC